MCAHRQDTVSFRWFQCVECELRVCICPRCDRGQTTCGRICSKSRRRRLQRHHNSRHQRTRHGAQAHARRQAAYRQRINPDPSLSCVLTLQKVTEQGSPSDASLPQSEPDHLGAEAEVLPGALTHEVAAMPAISARRSRGGVISSSPRSPLSCECCTVCGARGSGFVRYGWLRSTSKRRRPP